MSDTVLYLILLFFLLIFSAFFSGTETAVMSINRYRLRHKAQKGDKTSQKILDMIKNPEKFLALVLIGNNLVNIAASSIATILSIKYFGDYAIAVATFGLTFIVLIFCEITPKTIAALKPELIANKSSVVISFLMTICQPLIFVMNTITKIIISIFGIKKKKSDESLTTDELKSVLSTENNTFISKSHKEILIGVLDLEKISVDEIMVPRNELFAININDDWKDIQKQITNTPHTRILLYRNSIDDIIGFIHTRDALRLLTKEDFSKENLLRTIEEAYFIPENTNLLVQLQKFRRNKKRCGLVIDEYGDIQGLVTIDDILEEIVGDFTTSIDVDLDEEIIKQKDGSFIIDGQTTIRDLNKELDAELDTSGPVTLNGIILETLGDNPKKNVTVNLGNFTATITETDGISISKVKLTPKQKENEQDSGS